MTTINNGAGRRIVRYPLMVIAIVAATLTAPRSAPAADMINVALDQAVVTRLPDRIATIVVGNPLIADVSIQSGGLLIVTGKGYGVTNMLAFDRNGAEDALGEFLEDMEGANLMRHVAKDRADRLRIEG